MDLQCIHRDLQACNWNSPTTGQSEASHALTEWEALCNFPLPGYRKEKYHWCKQQEKVTSDAASQEASGRGKKEKNLNLLPKTDLWFTRADKDQSMVNDSRRKSYSSQKMKQFILNRSLWYHYNIFTRNNHQLNYELIFRSLHKKSKGLLLKSSFFALSKVI